MVTVLGWYDACRPRLIDLVGDYAGKELFMVEGDSLLRQCFEDQRIDFDDGFQMLHAVFVVEQFIESLIKRHCQFHIGFFDANRPLCVPSGVGERQRAKYLLARTVIIRHLLIHLPASQPDVHVHIFPSLDSSEFDNYLAEKPVHFIISHDGALLNAKAVQPLVTDSMPLRDKSKPYKIQLRRNILHINQKGLNVALINRIEFRDSKIFTMVVEGIHDPVQAQKFAEIADIEASVSDNDSDYKTVTDIREVLSKLEPVLKTSQPLPESSLLTITTVCELLNSKTGQDIFAAAMLLHRIISKHITLSQRRLALVTFETDLENAVRSYLESYAQVATYLLHQKTWVVAMRDNDIDSDLVDLVDGRLFRVVLKAMLDDGIADHLTADMEAEWSQTQSLIASMSSSEISLKPTKSTSSNSNIQHDSETECATNFPVMPFSNLVFDKHLDSVRLETETALPSRMAAMKIYRETSHWHNHRKPLNIKKAPEPVYTKWHNPTRTNQKYMSEMTSYAASLTGATGKGLEPEVITVGAKQLVPVVAEKPVSEKAAKKPGKKTPVLSKADQIRAANTEKKGDSEAIKAIDTWVGIMKSLDNLPDFDKYLRAKAYLTALDSTRASYVEPDINTYLLQALLSRWAKYCKADRKSEGYCLVALIWTVLRSVVASKHPLTKDVSLHCEKIANLLDIQDALIGLTKTTIVRKLSFAFKYPAVQNLSIDMQQTEFQLQYCGPYMDRLLDARPDPRVSSFTPDGWQRKVLDELDADNSVFVVAPTSAGKTFISFYAMEKVLRDGNDGVLVYVAPTKALVNQIAAEIQGRFTKQFGKLAGKSVWGIHTRDYRVNNSTGCQILVTVPHVLQIMLLSPSNAKTWAPRVRRIIFDEIHSIGNAEDGVVWEQLLLLAPCPIIALSATIGNPEEFADWLAETQKASGTKLTMIQHSTRYSDLRKYLWEPPKTFKFEGFGQAKGVGLGLDGLPGLTFFHPIASLIDKTRGMPDDLALEPRDCFLLWKAMVKLQTKDYKVPSALDPVKALPKCIKKADIFMWEKELKNLLVEWMNARDSPFDAVIKELTPALGSKSLVASGLHDGGEVADNKDYLDSYDLKATTLPLLFQLHHRQALPAILFNYDRSGCEEIAKVLLEQLSEAEKEYKKGKEWTKKMEGFEKWKTAEAKKSNKKPAKVSKKKSGGSDDDEERGPSKADQARDQGDIDTSPYASFDPTAPQENYSFADRKRAQPSEIEYYIRQLRWKRVPEYLISLLQRGIGVHHAGMNRKYRQCVEMLFRRGYLRVVVATGTLSLGINMPCATVVFSGDSVFLTALNFRQAAGRSGRRGFDLLGNVVFQGISAQRASRLLSSRLPDLTGHFPITTSLVLRLFTLLADSKNSPYAMKAINSLLSQPRLYIGGDSFKEQVLHHLRFSIEYLRRQALLSPTGQPVNWTSCVSHLYFTENSAFAFHSLLKEGYFSALCADIDTRGDQIMLEMMLTLSHIFGRYVTRETEDEDAMEAIKHSPSVVYLPPLPEAAAAILRKHNTDTLAIFVVYVKTFAEQHIKTIEDILPLTAIKINSNRAQDNTVQTNGSTEFGFLPSLPNPQARSSFVALSGHGDDFTTIEDLCTSTRAGVSLESSVIPHLEIHPDDSRAPLNSYLLDFFKHGSVVPLETANGIRKSDVWFVLNDFSMVLATIQTSLANYLGFGKAGNAEDDMLDVMGLGDLAENEKDEEEAAVDLQSTTSGNSTTSAKPVISEQTAFINRKSRKGLVDEWADAADAETHREKIDAEVFGENFETDDEEYDKLVNVYKAFSRLKREFDGKFFKIFA